MLETFVNNALRSTFIKLPKLYATEHLHNPMLEGGAETSHNTGEAVLPCREAVPTSHGLLNLDEAHFRSLGPASSDGGAPVRGRLDQTWRKHAEIKCALAIQNGFPSMAY